MSEEEKERQQTEGASEEKPEADVKKEEPAEKAADSEEQAPEKPKEKPKEKPSKSSRTKAKAKKEPAAKEEAAVAVEAAPEEAAQKVIEQITSLIGDLKMKYMPELRKALEEKFDVTAATPMMAMAAAPGGAVEAKEEEKTSFNVVLTGIGERKIQVIKAVRAVTSLGLREAKGVVDSAPQSVKEGVSKEEAEQIKAALEEAGATVEIK